MAESILPPLFNASKAKIFLLVFDGLGGLPRPTTGKTELETARTPNLDRWAAEGATGLVDPVGSGITPGSGPAHLALFGYDPIAENVGRGVLSALGAGLELTDKDLAARINFATRDAAGRITDRRAGRISTDEGKRVVAKIAEGVRIPGIEITVRAEKEHRAVVVFRGDGLADDLVDTDPQATGVPALDPRPRADSKAARRASEVVTSFLEQARKILASEKAANEILLRGFALWRPPTSFRDRFGLVASAIAMYPMYRGLARLVGMNVLPEMPSIEAEFEALPGALASSDYVYLHIKQTDSAGEDGDFDRKVAVIEQVDALLPKVDAARPDVVMVTGDHSTPSLMRAHSYHPVPLLMRGGTTYVDDTQAFGETVCRRGALGRFPSRDLMALALAAAGRLNSSGPDARVRPASDDLPGRAALLLRGALSGALLGVAFPPLDLWPAALVGLVPLLADLETLAGAARRGQTGWASRAFAAGFATGVMLYGVLVWWIVLLDAPALTIPWVRYPGTLAIVSFLALYTGLFAWAYVFVRARTGWPSPLVAGALWTAIELLRGWGELGFPWGTLGYAMVPFLPALQIAAAAGITGITFWIVATNALALPLLRRERRTAFALGAFAVVAVLPPALGAARIRPTGDFRSVRVALVQPSVGNAEKWAPEKRAEIFESMARLSREGVAQGARLVVWPETAAPCYLLKDREWGPWVEALAAELATPLFIGVPDYQIVGEGEAKRVTYTNTAALFDATGRYAGRMDKIRLVPFGERLPFSQWVPFLAHLDFGEADFLPGRGPIVFTEDGWKFGCLVCFEAIFPDLVRSYANAGAELLVNITNDSWFGAGSGAKQHENMAVARCVETGCGMARCANSGISVGIDPYGRKFGETPLFVRTVSVVDVPLRRERTLFDRLGDWVGGFSVAFVAVAMLAGFARRRRVM